MINIFAFIGASVTALFVFLVVAALLDKDDYETWGR